MKYLIVFFVVLYLLLLTVSLKGWGHVGNKRGDSYTHAGITYIHVGQSVRQGSIGGVGGRNSGRGGK